jgi:acylphosphatase
MMVSRHFIVSGRVQGVFYRQSTLQKANELKIRGWVKNLSNGDVEILACAEVSVLADFQDWLWQGPSEAVVTNVLAKDVDTQALSIFEIRY